MDITLDQIQNMIDTSLSVRESRNVYKLSTVPYHNHTGSDTGQVDFNFLVNNTAVDNIVSLTKLTTAATSLASNTLPNRTIFTFEIFFPTPAAGLIPSLQFNSDTGNNYGWQTEGTGGTTSLSAQASALIANPGTVTTQFFATGTIFNGATYFRSCNGQSMSTSGVITGAWDFHLSWNNTAQITSINLLANNGGNTLPSGTTLAVYGHNQV